jgi:hypothetical protein
MVADAYGVTTAVSLASVLVILVAIAFFIFCKPLRLLDPRLRENHQALNS